MVYAQDMGRLLLFSLFAWLLAGCESEVVDGTGGGSSNRAPHSCDFEHVWSKGIHMADHGAPASVAPGPDGGVFVAGELTGVVDLGGGPLQRGGLVARFDEAGTLLWARTYLHAYLHTIATRSPGRVLVAGMIAGTGDFGGGPLESGAFVAELDADGNHVWSRVVSDIGSVTFKDAVPHPDGDVVLAMSFATTGSMRGGIGNGYSSPPLSFAAG